MRKVLLDTNFILSCTKKKIDFFREILLMGIEIIIPEEVIKEIKNIEVSNQKLKDKDAAKLSLILLKINKFQKITLNTKDVDKGIINFALNNPEIIIATLDKEIKTKLKKKNHLLIIRGENQLEIMG
jgi:hypothetical protein